MPIAVRQVIAALEAAGWHQVRQRGSHRHFKHPHRPAIITIAGKPNAPVKRGMLADIRRKSGLEELR